MLLDTLMRFLCAPRVDFELRNAYTADCRCDLSLPLEARMHRVLVLGTTELWDFMAEIVAYAMNTYWTTANSPSGRSHFQSDEHPPWPSSPSDIIPYGLEATLDSLIVMIHNRVSSSFLIIRVFGAIFGNATVTAMLINHPRFPSTLSHYFSIWQGVTANVIPDSYAVEQIVVSSVNAIHKSFMFVMDVFSAPPHALRKFAERAGPPVDKFLVQWSQLLDFWLRAQASMPTEALLRKYPGGTPLGEMLDDLLSAYSSLGAILHSALELPRDKRRYHAAILSMSKSTSWMPIIARLDATARQDAGSSRCFGPACTATEATAARKFHVCGGCNHMKYCSKECQRRAWKDQRAPHKPMCKLIQELQARGIASPVWAADNIMPASDSVPELLPVFQALADHIYQLTA
ncbi:hypothetical protein PUNSTDRAFT_142287 [Punctularia strigosozonata HHB-11173 SS5]|uniref:uncharacterized protein n=1 Tax=Punctularia strigosozonata (strain HHB-11173) TaxID=741275 RepID=UPI0004417627|nr:uncharacterized protein PUNSTDRAFT_142287 [Punctularia strigosozonata HHB-11173 SS5]EIN10204.1 hypothetical protein PUNSTDRAFT_142287 [Punctularia strigosozonata HHB-11173 SS5]